MGAVGKSFVVVTIGAVIVAVVLRAIWTRESRARSVAARAALSTFTLAYCFLGLEAFAAYFLVQSDNLAFTRSSQRWMQMYWTPVNTFGYRDIEHDSDSLRGRRTAFVTGDSFVAGMGMSDYRDRFANVTGTELGSEWAVVVLAKNGWNTAQQIEALNAYPHQPDLIVLGYYVNDIEGAGFKHGYARPRLVDPPAGVLGLAVRHSYVLDVLYWRMYRFGNAQEMSAAYHAHLRRLYSDERVWTTHLVELDSVADYAADKGVPLIVLLIPWLTDVESSRPHLARVASHLAARDIPLINLVDQLVDRDPRDLVANPFDAHPSRALHSEIGRILADAIRRTAVRMEGA